VVITGTSEGGLGATTAVALAHAQPSKIFLLARTEGKVSKVIQQIGEISPSTQATFVNIELDDFDSVRKAAATILTLTERIDVLINNAGVMAIPWEKSKYGIEKTLAINHLGHFLLTKRLLPALIAAGPGSRVINLTSAGYKMGPFRFDDWNFSVSYWFHK
jgi:NAD(P)-dependent dehydrogenase (short-subunit alcohol dehydrogenase family)